MIQNKMNSKMYIGRSNDVLLRWKKHQEMLRNNRHYNYHLQKSWNKYGEKGFAFTVLEVCVVEDLGAKEIEWIAKHKSYEKEYGYNMSLGGEGEIPTEETREKRRQSMLGKNKGIKRSPQTVEKIRLSSLGRKHSSGTIEKLRMMNTGENHPNYGCTLSNEHRQNQSEAKLGEKNHFYGKTHNDTTRSLISQARRVLTDEQAVDIYKRAHNGEKPKELALEYGVSASLISDIKRMRRRYKEIITDAIGLAVVAYKTGENKL
jgi:hypothetical protein